MTKNAFFISIFSFLLLFSCDDSYKLKLEVPHKTKLNSDLTITLNEENNKPLDKVQFFINGKEVSASENSLQINTSDYGLGKHQVSALAFYPGKTKKVNNYFEVFAKNKPVIYGYEIVNSYPHNTKAYTQGLEYYNGFLYETTGRRGQSFLRKVDIKTGDAVQQIALDDKYFGEGMTIVNNKIYFLTWQSKKGFVYDLDTFKLEKEFAYDKSEEGWGLTNNGTELIKSDGTNKIWFLDIETLKEKRALQTYTHDRALSELNELELINGKLYANYYQKPVVAIINPENGVVEGLINLKGLENEMKKTQKLVANDEVLNGIAYDAKNDRLFVTGKNWGKLFEIKLVEK
jgi:glutamine cyclotransferase